VDVAALNVDNAITVQKKSPIAARQRFTPAEEYSPKSYGIRLRLDGSAFVANFAFH
jgi:hypothetical protein